jgi:hypothetical protein
MVTVTATLCIRASVLAKNSIAAGRSTFQSCAGVMDGRRLTGCGTMARCGKSKPAVAGCTIVYHRPMGSPHRPGQHFSMRQVAMAALADVPLDPCLSVCTSVSQSGACEGPE